MLESEIKELKQYEGCILTYGHFNTIHPGHIRYLKHAKTLGSKLVIALIANIPNKFIPFPQSERAEALELLGISDQIVLLKGNDPSELIKLLSPSVFVLGNEYQNNDELNSAIQLQKSQGGLVKFHAGEIHYANSDLLEATQKELIQKRKLQFLNACKRQRIELNDILESIEHLKKSRLIVLGDTIVDQYAACEAIGMSAEAPVVVVRELEKRNFIGGAAIVASHIKALGAKCDLISVVGADSTGEIVRSELNRQLIGDALIVDSSRPTTFKKRYVVENQKLFRVSRLEESDLSSEIEDKIIKKLNSLAPRVKGIVISDFVYGVVTNRILEVINSLANKYNLMLFGDLQCSSQVGSVLRFRDFSLLCPNEREARVALHDKDSGLEQLSKKMINSTNCGSLIMKLGSEGFIAYDGMQSDFIKSQSFPALSVNPVDVTGAGDSLLALMATALSIGQPFMQTAALATCIASIAVEKLGNISINADTLRNRITEVMNL